MNSNEDNPVRDRRRGIPVTFKGQDFPSINSVVTKYDLCSSSVRHRILLGDTPEAALAKVLANKQKREASRNG